MTESKGFMGHYGLTYVLSTPKNEVKERVAVLDEKQKRLLRIQQKVKMKGRREKEDRRREQYYK